MTWLACVVFKVSHTRHDFALVEWVLSLTRELLAPAKVCVPLLHAEKMRLVNISHFLYNCAEYIGQLDVVSVSSPRKYLLISLRLLPNLGSSV